MKEQEITAETALQKLTDIAKDAQRKQIQLTPTLILLTATNMLLNNAQV